MRRTWIKLYIDQCLRGSMMSELTPTGRYIWFGVLLMGGDSTIPGVIFRRKDENGGLLGFSPITIAETLDVPLEEYEAACEKMVKYGKISKDTAGVVYVINWKKYQSEYQRQKPYRDESRQLLPGCNEGDKKERHQGDTLDVDVDVDVDVEKNRPTKPAISPKPSLDEVQKEFAEFWEAYEYKVKKTDAFKAYRKLRMTDGVTKGNIAEAVNGYHAFLKSKEEDGFKQAKMYPATFLREERWKDYVGIKHRPRL